MSTDPFNPNSYVAFDGSSIRDLIINKLNQGQVFTDQNYQGSNISALIDIISYSFSTLLYYLNKTSSESMFSESQIYENMNRIVKLLNYNPRGKITQTLSYNIATDILLTPGNYIIPRYSYVDIGGTTFSFNKDIIFTNYTDGSITLQNKTTDFFLYQGKFLEYPLYNATGSNNEVLYLSLGNAISIDNFNIFVYVKSKNTEVWEQWTQSQNLFLNNSTDKVFSVRYNPNKNHEIIFGDDINGKKLNINDEVQVYYLNIDPTSPTVAINALNNLPITLYNSVLYNTIKTDTFPQNGTYLSKDQLSHVLLSNDYASSPYESEESVEDIRNNAPKNFSYQQRLVTTNDFQTYIKSNFDYIISDVYVVNNDDYLKGHIKYLYNIGINYPQLDGTILYNQIKFANSCNFNNVYVYVSPINDSQKYINASQKELILSELEDQKILTSQIIPIDPIYMAFDFYVKSSTSSPTISDLNYNKLKIYKKSNTRRSSSGIIADIINLITSTFIKKNVSFGKNVNISELASNISNIDGIEKIQTYRNDTGEYIDGLSLLVWNETYPDLDVNVHNQNLQLQYFQYPYFNNITNLISRIEVVETSGVIQITDF